MLISERNILTDQGFDLSTIERVVRVAKRISDEERWTRNVVAAGLRLDYRRALEEIQMDLPANVGEDLADDVGDDQGPSHESTAPERQADDWWVRAFNRKRPTRNLSQRRRYLHWELRRARLRRHAN